MTIPARLVLISYATFLFFYFVPWNLKNMDKASELEFTLMRDYGSINPMDEMGLAVTQLFAFACVVFSLISVYKCLVIAFFAKKRQTVDIWLYPGTVLLSILTSLFSHDQFLHNMVNNSDSILMFVQPLLITLRGVIFYKILYTQYRPKKVSNKDGLDKPAPEPPARSTLSKLVEFTSKSWFFAYWLVYALVGSFFYNEMVKFIIEDHIDLNTIVKFILV